MSSACRNALFFVGLLCVAAAGEPRELRVCSDPDNLPFSHEDGSGFENRIARLVAGEMHAELRYVWLPLRRGFVRKSMDAGLCDVLIGVPSDFERVMTTRPYYRSGYVFVNGPKAHGVDRFDDLRLSALTIGVQLVGNDLAATPPGYALAASGHVENVRGFTVYGDGPASQRMVAAVASGELDAALIWGPQAAYFADRSTTPIELRIARSPAGLSAVPFEFD